MVGGTVWHAPLIRHLLDERDAGRIGTRVADIGCGRFELGLALATYGFEVDGYDLSADRREDARLAIAAAGAGSRVFDSVDDFDEGSYDLVTFVGVLHYLDVTAIAAYLSRSRQLVHSGASVVITDLPTPCSSRLSDVRDLLATALRYRLYHELAALVRAMARDRSLGEWTWLTPAAFAQMAEPIGFESAVCERNLSPFRKRYSLMLRAS